MPHVALDVAQCRMLGKMKTLQGKNMRTLRK